MYICYVIESLCDLLMPMANLDNISYFPFTSYWAIACVSYLCANAKFRFITVTIRVG